jgi:hypothetical protein
LEDKEDVTDMQIPEKMDDKTLAILMMISEFLDKKHDPRHVTTMYERALEKVKDYRQSEGLQNTPPYTR